MKPNFTFDRPDFMNSGLGRGLGRPPVGGPSAPIPPPVEGIPVGPPTSNGNGEWGNGTVGGQGAPAWGRNFKQQYGMPPGHAMRDFRQANPATEMEGGLPGMLSNPGFLAYLASLAPQQGQAGAAPDLRSALANLGIGQGRGQGWRGRIGL